MTSGAGDGGTFRLFADWLAGANTEQCTFIHLAACSYLLISVYLCSIWATCSFPCIDILLYIYTLLGWPEERENSRKTGSKSIDGLEMELEKASCYPYRLI